MKFETLELVKQDKIATITFNRPELLNAVNEQFIWDFQKATSDVKEDDSIKVLIINASGRGFCAGADLSERKSTWEGSQDALMRGFKPFFENILSMPKPVIAAVQGPAAGIGASIAINFLFILGIHMQVILFLRPSQAPTKMQLKKAFKE